MKITVNKEQIFDIKNTLFVFALELEAAKLFDLYPHLICGVGKINATYNLMKEIQKRKPSLIINLGSAGSNLFKKGEIVCCNKFIQRDMDTRELGYQLYETPFSKTPRLLEYGLTFQDLPLGICGTGDNFEIQQEQSIYNVVDMEAYALAFVASQENIPFLSLKYISDGADNNAANDWNVQVRNVASSFHKILNIKH